MFWFKTITILYHIIMHYQLLMYAKLTWVQIKISLNMYVRSINYLKSRYAREFNKFTNVVKLRLLIIYLILSYPYFL